MNTKNTLKQRVLSVLLAFLMVLSMMPTSVFAEEGTTPPASEPEQLVTEPVEPTEPEAPTEAPTEEPTEAPIALYAADHVHKKALMATARNVMRPSLRRFLAPAGRSTALRWRRRSRPVPVRMM